MYLVRRIWFYLITAIIGLLLALLAGELLVRGIIPDETLWAVGKSNIYQAVDAPGVGYTYKPSLDQTAFGVDLKTNALGFRGTDWSVKKPTAIFRILLIGDSHAFGFGVPYQDSVGEGLAGMLERAANRPVEVLNFGVNGYNSVQELAVLKKYGLRFIPDLVVLMLSSNDHEPARWVDRDGWLYRKRLTSNDWIPTFDKSVQAAESGEFPNWMRHSHLALYLGIARQQIRAQQNQILQDKQIPARGAESWPPKVTGRSVSERLKTSVYAPVQEMIRTAKARGIPFVLGYYAINADYQRMINRITSEQGVPTVDLLSLFPEVHSLEELTAKFSLGWNPHLNAEAHRRWARAFAAVIERQGYL